MLLDFKIYRQNGEGKDLTDHLVSLSISKGLYAPAGVWEAVVLGKGPEDISPGDWAEIKAGTRKLLEGMVDSVSWSMHVDPRSGTITRGWRLRGRDWAALMSDGVIKVMPLWQSAGSIVRGVSGTTSGSAVDSQMSTDLPTRGKRSTTPKIAVLTRIGPDEDSALRGLKQRNISVHYLVFDDHVVQLFDTDTIPQLISEDADKFLIGIGIAGFSGGVKKRLNRLLEDLGIKAQPLPRYKKAKGDEALANMLYPTLKDAWLSLKTAFEMQFAGYRLHLAETYRSLQDQKKALARGTSTVRVDEGHCSMHNFRPALAFDVWMQGPGGRVSTRTQDDKWDWLASKGQELGLRPGRKYIKIGTWPDGSDHMDTPHFDAGFMVDDLSKELLTSGGFSSWDQVAEAFQMSGDLKWGGKLPLEGFSRLYVLTQGEGYVAYSDAMALWGGQSVEPDPGAYAEVKGLGKQEQQTESTGSGASWVPGVLAGKDYTRLLRIAGVASGMPASRVLPDVVYLLLGRDNPAFRWGYHPGRRQYLAEFLKMDIKINEKPWGLGTIAGPGVITVDRVIRTLAGPLNEVIYTYDDDNNPLVLVRPRPYADLDNLPQFVPEYIRSMELVRSGAERWNYFAATSSWLGYVPVPFADPGGRFPLVDVDSAARFGLRPLEVQLPFVGAVNEAKGWTRQLWDQEVMNPEQYSGTVVVTGGAPDNWTGWAIVMDTEFGQIVGYITSVDHRMAVDTTRGTVRTQTTIGFVRARPTEKKKPAAPRPYYEQKERP